MAGRPPLRIGQFGKITRKYLGDGVWIARCRYRDSDGVVRIVQRRGPVDEHDKHGKLAADLLVESLIARRAPQLGDPNEITLDTKIAALVEQHLARLAEDGRSPATLDTYKVVVRKMTKYTGDLRLGEATPARLDAALRTMRRCEHGQARQDDPA
jgi:hypothetical protein